MKCIRSFIIGLLCGAFIFGGTAVLANSDVLAKITSQIFFWNNEAIELEAYNINGYNYVRLRDVAKIFGVNVEYYEDTNSVYLGEDKKEEAPKPENKVLDGNAYAKEDYSQSANQAIFNEIYTKDAWLDEFNVNGTKPDQFNNADGTKITVDFMNKTDWMPYAETKSVQMIELPYLNRVQNFSDDGEYIDTTVYKDLDVSMYLIMADGDINPEAELSAAINDEAFKNTYIRMAMPKFKIEYSTKLNDMLMNMGINTAFEPSKAEFEKMFDSGTMWFTDTIHKTFINVDEKGTEAAAVTAIAMAGSALPPEPLELRFNKPFYFAIRDNTSGETLFMGRYAFAN